MKSDKKLNVKLFALRAAQVAMAILFGLCVGFIVIAVMGHNPLEVYYQLFSFSFFQLYYFLQTLTRSIPIAFSAIAVIISWRAGYINLGVEGQMIVGGLTATLLAVYLPGPNFVVGLVSILGGMGAGAFYAVIGAFLFLEFNVPLVISSLMMNYIASYIGSYLVTYPFRDSATMMSLQTKSFSESLKFPTLIEGTTFNIAFVILILTVVILLFVLNKSKFGYESKITGLNREFAKYGGISDKKLMYRTMALSGALAAMGGICEIFGAKLRYTDGMFTSASYAWTGLMAALISGLNLLGSFFASIFLSMLQVGGQAIQRTMGIPLQLATVIQSSITLFVSMRLFSKSFTRWRAKVMRKNKKSTSCEGVQS
uniref:ABC transporter permease n=1 Tax=Ndongobacter massiliensis TaxID=1871025 RepID=UPI000931AB17|nr:ABC transporter permease [Ndongobacter massiliensis]